MEEKYQSMLTMSSVRATICQNFTSTTLQPIITKYKNFWATSIQDNFVKLNYASKTLDALITSSYQIDGKHEVEVGSTTIKFCLDMMPT